MGTGSCTDYSIHKNESLGVQHQNYVWAILEHSLLFPCGSSITPPYALANVGGQNNCLSTEEWFCLCSSPLSYRLPANSVGGLVSC